MQLPRLTNFRRAPQAGFTLIELLVAVAVLSMITVMIYSAFAGLANSKHGITRVNDRYREGRGAMQQITRDLQSAYLSLHKPIDPSIQTTQTVFIGKAGSRAARLDFASFAFRRFDRDAHLSDQAEISYFESENPNEPGTIDLVRRVSPHIDLEPTTGGRVEVLATDMELFDVSFLDPATGNWLDSWDTTQATGQVDRLPLQARFTLVLKGGSRASSGGARESLRFLSKVDIPMQQALTFAME